MSLLLSLPSTPEQMDIFFFFKQRHVLAEILARRGKRRTFKTTKLQNPKSSQVRCPHGAGKKRWDCSTKTRHVVRPSVFAPRSDKIQLAIGSRLHHLFCGVRCAGARANKIDTMVSAAKFLGVTGINVAQQDTSGSSHFVYKPRCTLV